MRYDLLGQHEAAALLGVSRQRFLQLLQSYDDFPDPVAVLRAGRIWTRSDVEAWATKHGRSVIRSG